MLAALRKQLQQEHRAAPRAPLPGIPSLLPALPGSEPEVPLPPLSQEAADKLERVRDLHPRLHASLSALDTAQLGAILSEKESLLLRAPVGSGKTSVLVHK